MNNLKENIFNFGVTIYLMSRADRQAANRYLQSKKSQRSVKHIWFLPTLKPNAEKPKELALSQPTQDNE
jgi:hypothetical protein